MTNNNINVCENCLSQIRYSQNVAPSDLVASEGGLKDILSPEELQSNASMINPSAGKFIDGINSVRARVNGTKKRLKQVMKTCFQKMRTGDPYAIKTYMSGRYKTKGEFSMTGNIIVKSYIPTNDPGDMYNEGIMPLCLEIWPKKDFQSKKMWLKVFDEFKKDRTGHDDEVKHAMEIFCQATKSVQELYLENPNYATEYKLASQALEAAQEFQIRYSQNVASEAPSDLVASEGRLKDILLPKTAAKEEIKDMMKQLFQRTARMTRDFKCRASDHTVASAECWRNEIYLALYCLFNNKFENVKTTLNKEEIKSEYMKILREMEKGKIQGNSDYCIIWKNDVTFFLQFLIIASKLFPGTKSFSDEAEARYADFSETYHDDLHALLIITQKYYKDHMEKGEFEKIQIDEKNKKRTDLNWIYGHIQMSDKMKHLTTSEYKKNPGEFLDIVVPALKLENKDPFKLKALDILYFFSMMPGCGEIKDKQLDEIFTQMALWMQDSQGDRDVKMGVSHILSKLLSGNKKYIIHMVRVLRNSPGNKEFLSTVRDVWSELAVDNKKYTIHSVKAGIIEELLEVMKMNPDDISILKETIRFIFTIIVFCPTIDVKEDIFLHAMVRKKGITILVNTMLKHKNDNYLMLIAIKIINRLVPFDDVTKEDDIDLFAFNLFHSGFVEVLVKETLQIYDDYKIIKEIIILLDKIVSKRGMQQIGSQKQFCQMGGVAALVHIIKDYQVQEDEFNVKERACKILLDIALSNENLQKQISKAGADSVIIEAIEKGKYKGLYKRAEKLYPELTKKNNAEDVITAPTSSPRANNDDDANHNMKNV